MCADGGGHVGEQNCSRICLGSASGRASVRYLPLSPLPSPPSHWLAIKHYKSMGSMLSHALHTERSIITRTIRRRQNSPDARPGLVCAAPGGAHAVTNTHTLSRVEYEYQPHPCARYFEISAAVLGAGGAGESERQGEACQATNHTTKSQTCCRAKSASFIFPSHFRTFFKLLNEFLHRFISTAAREIFERACAHADVGEGRVSLAGLDDVDSICPKRGPGSEGLSTRMVTHAVVSGGGISLEV